MHGSSALSRRQKNLRRNACSNMYWRAQTVYKHARLIWHINFSLPSRVSGFREVLGGIRRRDLCGRHFEGHNFQLHEQQNLSIATVAQ